MVDFGPEFEPPPGPLSWFPWGRQDFPGWRFDVITLLAIIGESSVADHVQTITASSLCLLPRIIPAPQALLRPTRPQRLPEVTAKMAGVYGGTILDTVGFFANIMHPLDEEKAFAFKVLDIRHKHLTVQPGSGKKNNKKRGLRAWLPFGARKGKKASSSKEDELPQHNENTTPGVPSGSGSTSNDKPQDPAASNTTIKRKKTTFLDEEAGHTASDADDVAADPPPMIKRAPTERLADVLANPTMVNSEDRYMVPPSFYSPMHGLNVLSFLLTIGILIAAGFWEDGTAIVATILIAFASSVMGYASWWRPLLMNRRTTNIVPKGDVVIRTREGAFVLIRCTEEVARELYSGTEECRYVSTKYHRAFMGLGMVLLMVAIVLLGNCGWNSQVAIGGAYVLLNGMYWLVGLLPQKYFWDLDNRYVVKDVTPDDAKYADLETSKDPREGTPSFTRTLWYAIRETPGRWAWVERSGALPNTEQWRKWLMEAVRAAKEGNRQWQAVGRKNEIMKEDSDDASLRAYSPHSPHSGHGHHHHFPGPPADPSEQAAPLTQVQAPANQNQARQGGF